MKPSELLNKFGWCKGTNAMDAERKIVNSDDESACFFCALGAIGRCYDSWDKIDEVAKKFENKVRDEKKHNLYGKYSGTSVVVVYNDRICSSKEELIAVFEEIGE